jgi:hypothetical protein
MNGSWIMISKRAKRGKKEETEERKRRTKKKGEVVPVLNELSTTP